MLVHLPFTKETLAKGTGKPFGVSAGTEAQFLVLKPSSLAPQQTFLLPIYSCSRNVPIYISRSTTTNIQAY